MTVITNELTPPAAARHASLGRTHKPVQWAPADTITREEWLVAGVRFGAMSRLSNFLLGDWLRFGHRKWGVTYAEAAKVTGYDVKTLYKFAHVASRVEVFLRRKNLTWSHHELVAPLQPNEQERWLERAEELKWSVEDLRIELRAVQRVDQEHDPRTLDSGDAQHDGADPSANNDSDPHRQVIICPNCGEQLTASQACAAVTTEGS